MSLIANLFSICISSAIPELRCLRFTYCNCNVDWKSENEVGKEVNSIASVRDNIGVGLSRAVTL